MKLSQFSRNNISIKILKYFGILILAFSILSSLGYLGSANTTSVNAEVAEDITTDLVGHWKFNQTSGSTVTDSSGLSNNITVAGGAHGGFWDTDRPYDSFGNTQAGYFIADVGTPNVGWGESGNVPFSLTGTNDKSICGWVNPTASETSSQPFAIGDFVSGFAGNDEAGFGLWEIQGDTWWFVGGNIFFGQNNIDTQIPVKNDEWNHYCVTFSGGSTGTVRVYENGTEEFSFMPPVAMNTTNEPLRIGRFRDNFTAVNANTKVDDIRLYARELNSSEVARLATVEEVVISEVEYDTVQTGADTNFEWIELYNRGDQIVDLSGWSIEDTASNTATIPNGVTIPPGGYRLLANNITSFQTNYPAITPDVDLSPSVGLNNTSETLVLRDDSNQDIDFVAWEGGASGWSLAASPGESICRTDPTMDTDLPGDFMICTTPSPATTILEISGEVYHDEDGEGDKDASETNRLEGVLVSLYEDTAGDGTFDGDEILSVSMDSAATTGAYSFSGITAGDYLIVVDIADTNLNRDPINGSVSTYGITTNQVIPVSVVGASLTNQDFGFDNAFLELTSVTPTSISEESGVATWTLTQSIATGFTTDIGRELAGSTATFIQDFSLAGDIRIFPGETTSTFTSTGLTDQILEGDETIVVTLGLNFGGSNAELGTTISQTITLTDDEVAGFTIDPMTSEICEDGCGNSFDIQLDAQPINDVVIDFTASSANYDLNDFSVSPASVTFTNSNWNTPQEVNFDSVDNDIDANDGTVNIVASVNDGSSDNGFDGVADQTVVVTITDDDDAGVTVDNPTGITVTEDGANGAFSVVLDSEPTSNVVIDVSSSDTGAVTVSNNSLTFTPGNWNDSQDITITPISDDDVEDESVTITFAVNDSSSDDVYDTLADIQRTVNVNDNDTAGFTVIPDISSGSINEGETKPNDYNIVLDQQPLNDVVIDIISSNTDSLNVDTTSLTFTPSNWSTQQSVSITAPEELNTIDEQDIAINFVVNDLASDDNWDGLTDSQLVDVVDNDEFIDVSDTIPNIVTNEDVEVSVRSSCGNLDNLSTVIESTLGEDVDYEYPLGLINYEIECGSADIEIHWYGVDQNVEYTVRKEDGNGNFYDFQTTNEFIEIGGENVLRTSFSLTDGGFGDNTGVDGVIVDPIGLGVAVQEENTENEMMLIRTGGEFLN